MKATADSVLVRITPEVADEWLLDSLTRTRQAIARPGSKHKYGHKGTGWKLNIVGVPGEHVVAQYLGIEWQMGNLGDPDVGDKHQVRTTKHPRGRLTLHDPKSDKDNDVFWLVIQRERCLFEVVGWITGAEGRRVGEWGDPQKTNRPAYWVAWKDLHPPHEWTEQQQEAA